MGVVGLNTLFCSLLCSSLPHASSAFPMLSDTRESSDQTETPDPPNVFRMPFLETTPFHWTETARPADPFLSPWDRKLIPVRSPWRVRGRG